MADEDSNALTRKIGPLPIWVWMALVFVAAMVFSYAKKGAGKGAIDPETGLPLGTSADQQAMQQLNQLQNAASRGAGGSQTPPTIIQNYPASTTTIAFPLHGSAFGSNGSPSWPVHAPHARKGGPGPRGPGHKPWEHGDHGWNGGEPHHHGGGPGAGHDHDRHHHQGHDGGHGGDHDHPGGRPGWGGGHDQGGGWGGGHGDDHDHDHGGRGGDHHDDHGHGGEHHGPGGRGRH
jgi:hypothetical protein